MAVLQLKPCRLSYLTSSEACEDENGDLINGNSQWEGDIECGSVPAGKSNERKFEDGNIKAYSYTLTLPANCRDFAIGDRIKLRFIDHTEREFQVLGFHRYQLQCKMWV